MVLRRLCHLSPFTEASKYSAVRNDGTHAQNQKWGIKVWTGQISGNNYRIANVQCMECPDSSFELPNLVCGTSQLPHIGKDTCEVTGLNTGVGEKEEAFKVFPIIPAVWGGNEWVHGTREDVEAYDMADWIKDWTKK